MLRRTAPLWLVRLPLLVDPGELAGLQRQVEGLQSERMLREVVEVYRLQGDLLLVQGDESLAARCQPGAQSKRASRDS